MAGPKAKASTQQHLDIEDITDDVVILKTGWVALVMQTTAINFDLLAEVEQDATIYAYGAFLNSLSFPLQVLIRSKKADITSYFQHLEEAERTQPNPDLKRQIQKYEEFIQLTVQQKTILDKRFYLIITYSPVAVGVKGINTQKEGGFKSKAHIIEIAKSALAPKRDHIIKQTARLGISTRQLVTQELVELFYDIYNPAPSGTQRVLLDTASYTTPLVEPAIANPTPASGLTVEKELISINRPQSQAPELPHLAQTITSVPPQLSPVPPQPTPSSPPTPQPPAPYQKWGDDK